MQIILDASVIVIFFVLTTVRMCYFACCRVYLYNVQSLQY